MVSQEHPPHIIGIEASAGGLEALARFFRHMPADSGCVFVVTQPLSPDHSHMAEVLARYTDMPVHEAEHNIPVRANHIYLVPPGKHMMIENGLLHPADDAHHKQMNPSARENLEATIAELEASNAELQRANTDLLTIRNTFEEKIRQLTALNHGRTRIRTSTEGGTIFRESDLNLPLRESEARYRTLVDNLPNSAVFLYDTELRYLLAGGEFLEATGYSRTMVEGKTIYEVLPPEARATVLPYYEASLRGEATHFELQSTGGIYYDAIAVPIHDEHNQILGGMIVARDITERKQYEEKLEEAKNLAEAASHAKSRFLASMSHELRTPLNAILGFAQVLERNETLNPTQRDQVKIIERSGQHLLRLINQVLDISRVESGETPLNNTSHDLHALIYEVTDMMQGIALQKTLHFESHLQPDVPRHVILDGDKLKQILINLIGNAIKYTDDGSVTLHVHADASILYFKIQDTGRGIAPAALKDIFNLYRNLSSVKFQPDGTGLGLPLSRSFARLMGGDLYLESILYEGTRAIVSIPCEVAQPTSATTTGTMQVLKLTPDQEAYRILIAEDLPENQKLLTTILETAGYQTRSADDGKAALELVQAWQPHLVLMDMRMPVMDGYEATRLIKQEPAPPLVIALSASVFSEQKQQMYAAGCDDIILKPFRAEDIFTRLEKHLGAHYVYRTLEKKTEKISGQLGAQHLKPIATPLLATLYEAVVRLDTAEVKTLIHTIQSENELTGIILKQMVDDFRYDRIRHILKDYLDDINHPSTS